MGRTRSRTLLAVALSVSMFLASCSVTEGLLGSDKPEETTASTIVNDSDKAGDSDETDGTDGDQEEGGGQEDGEAADLSIWTRADDSTMRPNEQETTFSDSLAPGAGRGWTIVGFIFDYETNTAQPVSWEADELRTSTAWKKITVTQPNGGSASMSAAARTDSLDVAVGSHGQEQDRRPAVWIRAKGEQWRSADRAQFDSGSKARMSLVAAWPKTGELLAVGNEVDDENNRNPTIWTSADGENWQAVDGLPFAMDGSESIRGLATGPDLSVITGDRSNASEQGPIAFWSTNGKTWKEAQIEAPEDSTGYNLAEVTWFIDRFVAVGEVATNGVFEPASWTSSDGRSWELQKVPFERHDDGRAITSGFGAYEVTSNGTQLYATATKAYLQHLWTSTDGTNWTVVDNILQRYEDGVAVASLTADDEHVLLPTYEPSVVFHKAERGFRTRALDPDLFPFPSKTPSVSDIAYTAQGWIAVGAASTRHKPNDTRIPVSSLWESPDGSSWTITEGFPGALAGPMNAVAASPDGAAIVGAETIRHYLDRGVAGAGLLWQSSASDWDKSKQAYLSGPYERTLLTAATFANGALIVGGLGHTGENADAQLMEVTDPESPLRINLGGPRPDDEQISATCGNDAGEAAAFMAIDWRAGGSSFLPFARTPEGDWSEAEVTEEALDHAHSYVVDCAFGSDGFLAANQQSDGLVASVGLLTSPDGRSWEELETPPVFSTGGPQWVHSMVATEAGYLLAGVDGSSEESLPVVWYGSGQDWQQIVVGDDTIGMGSLNIGFADGTIVVIGNKNGAERVYTTTLDQLVGELDQNGELETEPETELEVAE